MTKQQNVSAASYIDALKAKIDSLESMVNEMAIDVKSARRTKFPKKTQSASLHNLTRSLCVSTLDPLKENRVRFYHPILHGSDTPVKSLPFAKPISTMGGFDDCGLNWVPPAGSTLCMLFENGVRSQPYYIGTMWHRDRGPSGSKFGFPVPEFTAVSKDHRKGYLVGANDESQVLPPWNTESYNGKDFNSIREFVNNAEEQRRLTYPNIYGFKTPEKHMLKMVDGDAKCNRRWKRIEIQSGCGNWMIFKDDHIHYGGQWSHPSCPPSPGGADIGPCSINKGDLPYFTDPHGKPIEKESSCNDPILGGHPSTPDPESKYYKSQTGANKYFKHQNECRPYKGPGTPQNNRCDLPQSGIQFLSIGGHTMVMDDSVEEPRGKPIWERSMEQFDFGCNDKFQGRLYMKSATGHSFTMSDIEEDTGLRGKKNYIELKTATGNKIQMNDETIGSPGCIPCPPNYAGPERGIHMQSTSNHQINMVDHMNKQCGPCRTEGGVPEAKATQAYVQIKSGYGLEMRYQDDNSQEETQNQWIQITHQQCVDPQNDPKCNKERGPHFLRFQGRPQGQPGVVMLRAGGHAIRQTYDMDIVLVGDKEKNPSDKFTYVSKMHIRATEQTDFRYAGELHILFAEKYILLMAGRDCPPPPGKKCCGPCLYPVILGRCPQICPLTGFVHWTEMAMSERVFASGYMSPPCPPVQGCSGAGAMKGCKEDDEATTDIDTGNGTVTAGTGFAVNATGGPTL